MVTVWVLEVVQVKVEDSPNTILVGEALILAVGPGYNFKIEMVIKLPGLLFSVTEISLLEFIDTVRSITPTCWLKSDGPKICSPLRTTVALDTL